MSGDLARHDRLQPRSGRSDRDAGFTLVELLIAIVLSGIIAGVTVGAMATSMNVATSTSQEVADSTDAGLISAFLFRDAQASGATDPATATVDATVGVATAASISDPVARWGGCMQAGAFVARFSWIDVSSATDRHTTTATYALDGEQQLTRRLCANGVASDLVLGHHLTAADARCLPDAACTDLAGTVALTLSGSGTRAPFTYTLNASLRVDAPQQPRAGSTTPVSLLAMGDPGSKAPCPNLTLGRAPVTVVGDAVIGTDCGPDPIAGEQKLLRVTGTLSSVRGVRDPFATIAAPAQACDQGKNPSPVGTQVNKTRITTYPSAVAVSGPVEFEPGTYVFCNGLTIDVGATVVGKDVFLVVAGGTFSVSDQATVHLAADRSGDHANLLVWVATSQTVSIAAGTVSGTLDGYVYAPTSQVVFGGNGPLNIGGVVAQGVTMGGTGALRFGLPVVTMSVAPSALPNGQVGVAYPSTTLTASGGTSPYRWSATGLPEGVVLDADTGVVSGSPKSSGAFGVVVTVLDATSASTSVWSALTITPSLRISGPGSLPPGEVGVALTQTTMTATGGTPRLAWTATGLAAGLSIDPASGSITGTPKTAGSFSAVVSVTDAVGAVASATYAQSISAALAIATKSLPTGQSGVSYPATTMQSSGGAPAYTWTATGLPDGVKMSPSGSLSGTPVSGGSFAVVVRVADGFSAMASAGYTLVVNKPLAVGTTALPAGQVGAAYPATTLSPSGGTAPYTWSATGLPAGLVLDPASALVSGTPTAAGTADVAVTVVDATGATSSAKYSLVVTAAPTITGPPTVPNGQVGSKYASTTIVGAGGTTPYLWSATGLPPGLSLDSATGVLSGLPTTAGTFPLKITMTDAVAASATIGYTVSVASSLAITTATLPASQVGSTYAAQLTVAGGSSPYTWSATGLPPGLELSLDGVISGTTKTAGSYSIGLTVTDAAKVAATRNYTVTVSSVPAGCPAAPSGWRAEYFANNSLTAPAKLCRNDADITFDWGTGAPASGLPVDNFSVRWTRTQDFAAGTYVFSLGSDDGGRLYIDGVLVLDRWVDQAYPNPVPTTSQKLTGGSHDIVMEYYERGGYAAATLSWAQYVPVTCPSNPSGWVGQYYANNSLASSPVVCRDDTVINFDWAGGSPAPNVPVDNFSARWTRTSMFKAGTFTFTLGSDDGGRLYIDGALVLDKWVDQGYPSPQPSVTKALTAGAHTLVVEYYERGGLARATFVQSP